MVWRYEKIRTSVMPPCPWCRRVIAVKRDIGPDNRYECQECRTRFEARFDSEPISVAEADANTARE